MNFSHLNCTFILPGKSYPDSPKKWLQERTHGCWCSAWKLLPNGEWRIWRKSRWCRPKPGELRRTNKTPPGQEGLDEDYVYHENYVEFVTAGTGERYHKCLWD